MKRTLMAVALSTCCLAVSACHVERIATAIPIPADRMDCTELAGADGRPTIPPEYVIDWSKVTTVQQAHAEHDAFVTRLRERERPVTLYVVRLEGRVFACADDAAWLRDYTSRLPKSPDKPQGD
jgi:hypothetical protein